jgi:hypothetical protein
MNSNENTLASYGGVQANSLGNIVNYGGDDEEANQFKASSYYSTDEYIGVLRDNKNNFNLISLNTQSLNAKYNKLVAFNELLNSEKVSFSALCLQESWLGSNADSSIFQLSNYNCIPKSKHASAHGGLITYLHKKYNYTILNSTIDLASDIWEYQIIDIPASPINKHIILINVYRPPKDNTNASIKNLCLRLPLFCNYLKIKKLML